MSAFPQIYLLFRRESSDKTNIMISCVNDHLFIGEQTDAESPPPFITAVLWTALDTQIRPPSDKIFARLPLKEYTEPDLIDLGMGIDWIARHISKHRILVACRLGLGRSPSIIIAYLCYAQGLSFEEAQTFIAQKRPGTTPLPYLASLIEQLPTNASTPNPPSN